MNLKSRGGVSLCLLSTILVFASPAAGQTIEKGAIGGTVFDPSGAVVPDVSVTITNVATGSERSLTTGPRGRYHADVLPAGEYRIEASASGFATTIVREVRLAVGQSLTQDINLQLAAVGLTVEVLADAGPIDRSETRPNVVIDNTFIEELPISGRDFRDFAVLSPTADVTPGLRSPIRLNGQIGAYTGLIIDGVDNRNSFFGEWWGSLETKNYTISQDAVQEFQVRDSGFSAEFGHALGGLINVVTKSGTKDLHGTAFWFFQNNTLFSDNTVPAFPGVTIAPPFNTSHQFGGSVGGPIVRDKAFFFFAIDVQEQGGPLGTAFFNDFSGIAVPELGISDLAGLAGGTTQRQDLLAPLVKFDFNITPNHTATTRINYSRNETDNFTGRGQQFVSGASPDNFENFVNEGPVASQSLTSVINPFTVNEARFAYTWERRDRINNGPAPNVQITDVGGTDEFGRRFFLPITSHHKRFQVIDNFSRTFGQHDLKFGVDLNSNATNQAFIGFAGGVYAFGSLDDFQAICTAGAVETALGCTVGTQVIDPVTGNPQRRPSSFRQLFGINGFTGIESGTIEDFWQHELSFYVQDTWRIHPNVTLNLGIRWDGIWNPNPEFPVVGDLVTLGKPGISGNTLSQQVGPPPQGIPDDFDNWAPRVGVAWDATGDGKTIVRGGVGIYYTGHTTIFMADRLNGLGFRGVSPSFGQCPPPVAGQPCIDPITGVITVGATSISFPDILPGEADAALVPFLGSPNMRFIDPEFESPRVINYQIGFEREIVPDLSASFTYTHNESDNLRTGGFNTTPFDRTIDPSFVTGFDQFGRTVGTDCAGNPVLAFEICRLPQSPIPGNLVGATTVGFGEVFASWSEADYDAFIFQVKKTFSHRTQFQVNYTLSYNDDNASADRDTDAFFAPSDPFNFLELDMGRSQLDIRHQFRAFSYFLLPGDIELSNIFTARSGRAFPAYRGFCAFPTSGYQDGLQCSNFFLSSIRPGLDDGSGVLPRFPFRNSNFFQWDLRVGREFPLGPEGVGLRVTFEVFNLLDTDNSFSNTSGFNINGVFCGGLSSEYDADPLTAGIQENGPGPSSLNGPGTPISAQFGLKIIFERWPRSQCSCPKPACLFWGSRFRVLLTCHTEQAY